jgi:hypothetical protein
MNIQVKGDHLIRWIWLMTIVEEPGTQASMYVCCLWLVQQHCEAQYERNQRMSMYGELKKMKAGFIPKITVM